MIEVTRYTSAAAENWNAFVTASANGTFLFDRAFMDYHADRFDDHSLMVHDKGKLVAVMPANRVGTDLISHGGLTYGGLVHGLRLSGATMLDVFDAVRRYAVSAGMTQLVYKPVPSIYHRLFSEQDRYALFRMGAKRIRSDLSTAICLDRQIHVSKSKRQGRTRAGRAGIGVRKSGDWPRFWALLNQVLQDRHETSAVHSLDEMQLLADRFPDNISLHVGAAPDGTILAGAVLFDTGTTVHTQYLASSELGREQGALDAVILHLVDQYLPTHSWFDFGISTEAAGQVLNTGLLRQKEMFGGTSVVYDQYRIDLRKPA
ncbi:MAG: GNAT family N-acetyltransferase [Silicimonas sp.]|nr:GNAT family N-acetyltransferase [Silicimonas sp.]